MESIRYRCAIKKNNGTEDELFTFIASQAEEWTDYEKVALSSTILDIDTLIMQNGFSINFPDTIFFVKTTTEEEGGAAAYTRENYIVLGGGVASPQIILHELFHIISRYDTDFKREMYKIIGFTIIKELPFPDGIRKITNPDSPKDDSYITLLKDSSEIDCMMILYSPIEYAGGSFFEYLTCGFLRLTGTSVKEVEYSNNKPVIFSSREISNFLEQIGENTAYTIQPEEILAENFIFAIENKKGLPSQWVVDKMQDQLRK
ncbi:MAG: hypothetical protein JW863_01285 [Chitinispirillaceae bacterium]|nr:hypothetical protein [Chitinispirillaceae bacterium]